MLDIAKAITLPTQSFSTKGHPFEVISDPAYTRLADDALSGKLSPTELTVRRGSIMSDFTQRFGGNVDSLELFQTLQTLAKREPLPFREIYERRNLLPDTVFEELVLTCGDAPTF